MKMTTSVKFLSGAFALALLSGCGSSEIKQLQSDVAGLKTEVSQLKEGGAYGRGAMEAAQSAERKAEAAMSAANAAQQAADECSALCGKASRRGQMK